MALQSLMLSGNHVDASGAGSKGAAGQVRGGRVLLGMKMGGQSQLRVAPFLPELRDWKQRIHHFLRIAGKSHDPASLEGAGIKIKFFVRR